MKLRVFFIVCSLIAGFANESYAALVGSSRPVAQNNFQKIIKTNQCPSCDLAGVVLTRVDLSGANLEGANLAGAKLYLANLSGANLKNANLQGAALGGADLAGADLRGANLTGAVLEGAYLKDALLDGRIIDDKPYKEEGLPDVSEKKYQDDQSRGKQVPYTQDVVIGERRDFAEESSQDPADMKGRSEERTSVVDAAESPEAVTPKTLVPMADAVVQNPDSEQSNVAEQQAEPPVAVSETAGKDAQDGGFWGSITSIFRGDSQETGEEVAAVEPAEPKPAEQNVDQRVEKAVASPAQEIVVIEEVQPEAGPIAEKVAEVTVQEPEEMVIATVEPERTPEGPVAEEGVVAIESVPAVEPSADERKLDTAGSEIEEDDSGFWNSVASIFSSSDDRKEPEQESVEKKGADEAVQGTEVAADSAVRTARDELPPDADVRKMIEQIEGVAEEPGAETTQREEITESAAEENVQQDVVVQEKQVAASDEEEVTGTADAVPAVTEEKPAAGFTVSEMIEQIEADQVVELDQGDMVYSVQTPEQARAQQQMIIDRLLDEDLCVACDLAGVDLSGKNLDEVDLERANLQGANLEGIDLNEANLKGVNFSGANLKNADLREADLYLADFTGADLTGAKFAGALIDSADFTDAKGADLEGAIKEE